MAWRKSSYISNLLAVVGAAFATHLGVSNYLIVLPAIKQGIRIAALNIAYQPNFI
ncbi:MAG: hypothetical protein HKN28_12930 [Alphaproteobacteria bacterium]|nr:hypothetical protein [Alphaproteobacteria bacterium]